MSYILFEKSWIGCYTGEGSYEGGPLPDILISNVPYSHHSIETLFDMYVFLNCEGFTDHDKKDYKVKFLNNRPNRKITFKKITNKNQLVDCDEESIEIDYVDLIKWYSCEVDDEVEKFN